MNENELEFSLDDIVKEFHDESNGPLILEEDLAAPEVVLEEPQEPEEAVTEDTVAFEPAAEEPAEAEAEITMTADTIRLDVPVTAEAEPSLEDTVRLDDLSDILAAIPDGEAGEDVPLTTEETAEPFGENWEPEYEQPMGEYVPPQPIVFRPRSRLHDLKRKLVAGPEKRYYDLTEIGVGKLQLCMFMTLVILLLSTAGNALYAFDLVGESRMRFLIFVQVLGMLVSALLGCYRMMEGATDLFKGRRFTLNTMLLVSFLACCADSVFCLMELRVPCCAAFSLSVFMSLWNAYHKRSTEMGQMDTMRKATRLDSVVMTKDCFEGRPGFLRGEGQVEDFMDTYNAPSGPEKLQGTYALISLLICMGIAVVAGIFHGISLAFQVFATATLVAVPASFFVALSRPFAVLERRLHAIGTVLCGWQGVRGLCKAAVFPLKDTDIFPLGSTKMNGVKFYGDRDPDQVVAYAAALMSANGGGLEPIFTQLLDSRKGRHYDVENFNCYGGGGIGGEVCDEPVLMGSLPFLQDMGVEIPDGTMVSQAVYVAIDGCLAGVFAITYSRMKSAAAGMTTLCGYRRLTPVVTAGDFMLTESFLRGKFGVNTRRIAFPPRAVRMELAAKQPDAESPALALTTQEGLASRAFAVTGARALKSTMNVGLVVHILGGVLGMLIMLVLAILGSTELLTPVNVLLYQLVWMIPGLLITCWTKTV